MYAEEFSIVELLEMAEAFRALAQQTLVSASKWKPGHPIRAAERFEQAQRYYLKAVRLYKVAGLEKLEQEVIAESVEAAGRWNQETE